MSVFFTENVLSGCAETTLCGEDAHHIARALRMAVGDTLTVCDGEGHAYRCCITGFNEDREVYLSVPDAFLPSAEPPYEVDLFQGLPKGEKTESIIQKAVEGGISSVTLFIGECSVKQMKADSEPRKAERRKKIIREAAVQSGRNKIPALEPTVPFSRVVSRAGDYDLALFCYEGAGTQGLGSVLADFSQEEGRVPRIALLIGPEGGFSRREAEAAVAAGWQPVGLGPRILRTETAAIFVLGALSARFETV